MTKKIVVCRYGIFSFVYSCIGKIYTSYFYSSTILLGKVLHELSLVKNISVKTPLSQRIRTDYGQITIVL